MFVIARPKDLPDLFVLSHRTSTKIANRYILQGKAPSMDQNLEHPERDCPYQIPGLTKVRAVYFWAKNSEKFFSL